MKLTGFQNKFLVVSKNSFIKHTGMVHVCPVMPGIQPGPFHIQTRLQREGENVTVLCEHVKLIDPIKRGIGIIDRISYGDKMEVSDVIQGFFEYD